MSDLLLASPDAEALKHDALGFFSLTLDQRQLGELELLLNGAFAPLNGYMNQVTYDSVLQDECLPNGQLWPIPITLDVTSDTADKMVLGDKIALRDTEGFMLAVLTLEEKWSPDQQQEAIILYGEKNLDLARVQALMNASHAVYLAGQLQGIELPIHYEFETLWNTPAELIGVFSKLGWREIIVFVSDKPIHQMEQAILVESAKKQQANVLLHPLVGGDSSSVLAHFSLIHAYKAAIGYYPENLSRLSLLALSNRLSGIREIIWHGLIQQNFGCTQMLIDPLEFFPLSADHSMQDIVDAIHSYEDRLKIKISCVEKWKYDASHEVFKCPDETDGQLESFSHEDVQQALLNDQCIPNWFSYPEVIKALSRIYRPPSQQGFTIFFTGFSGSGKSTLAKILFAKLVEEGSRPVTLLDGDVVRLNLSSELGFSKKDRHINIKRIGFVASEIVKNTGVAICAPIAPYAETRREVRQLIEQYGAFIEIHVSTSIQVCESRDRKGLYAKARQGLIKEFTGISDPYDVPENPQIIIDTEHVMPSEAAHEILLYLFKEGYIAHV